MSAPPVPCIACIGIIGKHVLEPCARSRLSLTSTKVPQDQPLHIALFPPHASIAGSYLEFSFLLNASLDVFDLRARDKGRVDQDLGLLHAIDERLSVWGWETGTGVRFAIVLDVWGREGRAEGVVGIGEGDLKGVGTLSSTRRRCIVAMDKCGESQTETLR